MERYLLKEPKGIRVPDIRYYNQVIDYRAFVNGQFYKIPKRSVCVLNNHPDQGLVLLRPLPLFHAEAKKSLDLFLWDLRYREFIFLDQKEHSSERYFLPLFRRIKGSMGGKVEEGRTEVYLEEALPEDLPAVYLQTGEEFHVLLGLDLLESLMRRGLYSARAVPVKIRYFEAE